MDCRQYQDALNVAALGAVAGADVQAFRLHLEVCENCRREFIGKRKFLSVVDRNLQMQFSAVPSADFNARLRRGIAAEPKRAFLPLPGWWPVLAGAAALLALLVIFHFHRTNTPQSSAMNTASNSASPEQRPARTTSEIPDEPRHAASTAAPRPPETPLLHPVVAAQTASPPLKVRINRQELYAAIRFTQAVADGRIDAAPLLSAAKSADESAGAKPLVIPLIEMKPIEEPHADAGPTAH